MRKTLYPTILLLALGMQWGFAQSSKQEGAVAKKRSKDNKSEKISKSEKQSVKADKGNSLFENKKKSWAVTVDGGYPLVQGDIPATFGLGYGLQIEKALGYAFSLKLSGLHGYATGLNDQANPASSFRDNAGMNGKNNPATNYFEAGQYAFTNFKMNFTKISLDAVYHINNINLLNETPKFGLFVQIGFGAFLYDTKIDQADGSGNRYDYTKVKTSGQSRSQIQKQLKGMLDGNYETEADATSKKYLGQHFAPATTAGVGVEYKVSPRISLALEADYTFTGSDLLDGQRWYAAGVPTSQPDGFVYISLGAKIRLGRTDNVYWMTNPLALPYQTIMESKKKLEKVDKLEKDVDQLSKRQDTMKMNMDSLMTDADHDGVSDYFDKEDSTPAGAIVNGAGQTIFYKDADGNLVFVDPNAQDTTENPNIVENTGGAGNSGENGNLSENGGNNGNENGENGGTSTSGSKKGRKGRKGHRGGETVNGITYNDDGSYIDANGKKHKKAFNPGTAKKTIIMHGDGSGGYSSTASASNQPGTMTSMGLMPAVFFQSNSAQLVSNSYPQLFEVARMLKSNPNVKVHVVGFTDYRSTESYNKALGMNRSKAVIKALTTYFGVPKEQLIPESKGESEPLTNSKKMDALAANRRVQFEIGGSTGADVNGTSTTAPSKANNKHITKPSKKKVKKENTEESGSNSMENNSGTTTEQPATIPSSTTTEPASTTTTPASTETENPEVAPASTKNMTPPPSAKRPAPRRKAAHRNMNNQTRDNSVNTPAPGEQNNNSGTQDNTTTQPTTTPTETPAQTTPSQQDTSKKGDVFTPNSDF
jgi:outer membrane protein OmpA-like peptidoglycan-associated protein